MLEFELLGDTGTLDIEFESNTKELGFNLLGGTNNYKRLENKPKINNVELIDNKTLHELGIQSEGNYIVDEDYTHTDNNYTDNEKIKLASLENYDDTEVRELIDSKQPRGNYALKNEIPTKNSQLQNDSGFILEETDPTVPNYVKLITQQNITNWNNKQEQLISGTNIKTINNQNILGNGNINIESGASNYPDLTNKPKINNVELNGNKTSSDLGLQPAGNYALRSEIPDVSNFITNAVNNLLNYYLKSETYTKQEVNNLIGQIATLQFQVVNELPQTGDSKYIYLVPSTNPKTQNVKDEYIWTNNAWEQIGSTQVDLTGYATESWVNTQISGFLTQTQIQTLITNALVGYAKTEDIPTKLADLNDDNTHRTVTDEEKTTWNNKSNFSGDYNDLSNKPTIPKYYIGTSATGASTRVKVVECEGFVLEEGATISVQFTNAQTYNGYPYLNVNDTGNVAVQYKGGTAGIRYMWSAGEIIDFTYNGENWVCHGRALATTSYYGVTKLMTSAASDSQAYALTPRSLYYFANYSIAPYYSASKTYAVGDKVRYSYYIYECITAIDEPEAWTAAHWEQIDTLQEQIDAINTTIGNIDTILTRLTTGSGV